MQRHKGFTLIELMVTMAIVAIIAAVAYPAYTKSAQKGRRADAKSALTRLSQTLERCYTTNFSYKNCASITPTPSPAISQNGYYTLSVPSVSTTAYTVQATAISTGPQANDTSCTTMTMNNAGQQGSGSSTTSDQGGCW